uniref:Uncharacterized protein n=1 Tax=Arundo donax TaxID=35708 RepID=A0A0A9E3U1_ARUDO
MEITLRNLETAWSAISPNGCCCAALCSTAAWLERDDTRSSRLRRPAAAASWMASWSLARRGA